MFCKTKIRHSLNKIIIVLMAVDFGHFYMPVYIDAKWKIFAMEFSNFLRFVESLEIKLSKNDLF
jgi:hypothetical protein